MNRLQFVHYNGVEKNFTREQAIEYVNKLTNSALAINLGESLIGEPMAITYLDDNGKKQVLFAIGVEGEKGDNTLSKYHIIDSSKLEEDIVTLSGSTEELRQALENEITRATGVENTLQNELDSTQIGAGLSGDGRYVKNIEANYIANVTSLNDADVKLDNELARVEEARKNVTGQQTDEYVPNISLISRPLKYINEASDLNDADIKLDEGLQELNGETVKNIIVNNVSGEVVNNIAEVTIDAHNINIGEYEHYEGIVTTRHPIHDNYSVLDAVKQLDTNFLDFQGKEEAARKGIHIVQVTTGLESNVKEAYDLVDKDGHLIENSERIKIYKDSSLFKVYLGHVDDTLEDDSRPDFIPGTGDTALCFIYQLADGKYSLVAINVESFLEESEFKDGLEVNNNKVSVKIDDNSESFLTVSPTGIKLSGVTNAINEETLRAESVETSLESTINGEINRAQSAENLLSGVVNTLRTDVVTSVSNLNILITNEETNRQAADENLQNAIATEISERRNAVENEATERRADDKLLQDMFNQNTAAISGNTAAINEEIARATAAENYISGAVYTLSSSTTDAINDIYDKIDLISLDIVGNDSIDVTKTGDTSIISLLINNNDNVLEQDENGLKTNINLDISGKTVYLKGKDDNVISSVTVKDGMLDNVELVDDKLVFSFNEDADKQPIQVQVSKPYTVSGGSESYLSIEEYKIGVKVDVTDGLASFNALEASASTLDTKIDDETTRATDAETIISSAVDTLRSDTEVSASTLDTKINTETTRATDAEESLSGSINTLIDEVETLSGKVTELETELENVISGMTSTIYTALKSILSGTTNEIAIITDDNAKTITISFNNPYIVGEHNDDNDNDF